MPGGDILGELIKVENILKSKIEEYRILKENAEVLSFEKGLYKNTEKRIRLFFHEVEELRFAKQYTQHLTDKEIWQLFSHIYELLQLENWYMP